MAIINGISLFSFYQLKVVTFFYGIRNSKLAFQLMKYFKRLHCAEKVATNLYTTMCNDNDKIICFVDVNRRMNIGHDRDAFLRNDALRSFMSWGDKCGLDLTAYSKVIKVVVQLQLSTALCVRLDYMFKALQLNLKPQSFHSEAKVLPPGLWAR